MREMDVKGCGAIGAATRVTDKSYELSLNLKEIVIALDVKSSASGSGSVRVRLFDD
jgi:hypothetical protein